MCDEQLNKLINSAKKGDEYSINLLSHKYLDRGYRLVKNMKLINNKSIYEDQDYGFIIYKSLINSINKYEGQIKSPEAFIIQRMKRDIKKFFSRLISRKNLECMKRKCFIDDYDASCDLNSPEKNYRIEELINKLKNLSHNSDIEERVIIDFLIKGYGCQEISDKMQLKYTYIYNKIKKLRSKVKDINIDK